MQFEISDDAAILFAEELYTNLIGRQDPIDASVAEARKAIYIELDKVEWATPVLFLSRSGCAAVQLPHAGCSTAAPPPPGPTGPLAFIAPLAGPASAPATAAAAVAAVAPVPPPAGRAGHCRPRLGVSVVVVGAVVVAVAWPESGPGPTGEGVVAGSPSFNFGFVRGFGEVDGHDVVRFDQVIARPPGRTGAGLLRASRRSRPSPGGRRERSRTAATRCGRSCSTTTSRCTRSTRTAPPRRVRARTARRVPSPSGTSWGRAGLDASCAGDVASLTYGEDGLVRRIRFTRGCPEDHDPLGRGARTLGAMTDLASPAESTFSEAVAYRPAPVLRGLVRGVGYEQRGYPPGEHHGLPSRNLTFVIPFEAPLELSVGPDGRRATSRSTRASAGCTQRR